MLNEVVFIMSYIENCGLEFVSFIYYYGYLSLQIMGVFL